VADEERVDAQLSEQNMAMLEAAGCCVNCGHTWECDARDEEAGIGSCRYEKNDMLHDCPTNGPESQERYDRLVMGPIREALGG